MWSIRILKGPKTGEIFKLREGENTIGRSAQCDICIPSQGLSKIHAKIILKNNQISLQDMNSTNGTFVNGVQIKKSVLNTTDKIILFDVVFAVEFISETPQFSGEVFNFPAQIPQVQNYHPQNYNSQNFNAPMSHGANALDLQSDLKPLQNQEPIEKVQNYIDTVLLPGVYKLPEVMEFKWSIGVLVLAFVMIVTSLSVLPMIELTKSGIQIESQRRSLSLAKNLAERYQLSAKDGLESSFSTVPFEREEGVRSAYIISSGDGTIIAPARRAGTRPDDAFVHSARRQDQPLTQQINDNEIGATFPIKAFDKETGSIKVTAHAVILYDMGALSIDTSRTLSLFVQILLIALFFGFILYFFIYKIFENPIRKMNDQINSFLKEGAGFTESKYLFPALQDLINNINTLVQRAQNPSNLNSTPVNPTFEAQQLVQNYPIAAIAIDKNSIVLSSNSHFLDITNSHSTPPDGQPLDQLTDQSLILSLKDLIEQSKNSSGQAVTNSLEFNSKSAQISLLPIYDKQDLKYYLVTFLFQEIGGSF